MRGGQTFDLRWIALIGVFTLGCGGTSSRPPLLGAATVSGGGSHACALMMDGTARCWGDNAFDELGNLPSLEQGPPTVAAVPLVTGIAQIAAGGSHTCATLTNGSVSCWGNNAWGELGDGTGSDIFQAPSAVPSLQSVTAVAVTGPSVDLHEGTGEYSCAVRSDGSVACWGADAGGEIGNGANQERVPSPTEVAGASGARSLALGGVRGYALLGDGTVVAWGSTLSASATRAAPLAGVANVVGLAAGAFHGCALLADGTVQCWGLNDYGQLGNGSESSATDEHPPQVVAGLSDAIAITAGANHTCALVRGGSVYCWGDDSTGQLGHSNGDLVSHDSPVPVTGITNATAVSAGQEFTCALLADTSIRCWGANESDQLGDGTTSTGPTSIPVAVLNH